LGSIAFIDGRFLKKASEARVFLTDRGYLFGDGAFETLRAYAGAPFELTAHLTRLKHSAEVLGIPLPYGQEEMDILVRQAIDQSALGDAYVRITVSRGIGKGGIGTTHCGPTTFSILVQAHRPYPADAYASGIETAVVRTRRVPAACLDPTIKSANYLPQIMAKRELERQGLIEGIQLAVNGEVVSGTVSNVFLVRHDELVTPRLESGCLPGITRQVVLEMARALGLATCETAVAESALPHASELFFTGTLMEILPVRKLANIEFPPAPGKWTQALREAFEKRTWKRE
jgi:branched-chain amino acid aminotransferase